MIGFEQLIAEGAPAPLVKRGGRKHSIPDAVLEGPHAAREVEVDGKTWLLERGVDVRSTRRARGITYPFEQMEIGEAVFIPWELYTGTTMAKAAVLRNRDYRARTGVDRAGRPGWWVFRCL